MIVSSASASHSGLVRANNEDALIARLPPESPSSTGSTAESKGALFAVADGVGGANAGEIASQAAVAVLAEEYYSPRAPHQIEAALRQAMTAANLRVYNLAHGRDPDLHGMQTTLTALVLAGNQAYIGHIGDCRVYVWRGGGLTQLTNDHSEAAELLRLRLITPAQARDHPRRSVLTRVLGQQLMVRPDYARVVAQPGDRFLMCSDGLWGLVDPEALLQALALPPEQACPHLVQLACDAGGVDNITAQLVQVIEVGAAAPPPAGRLARLLAGLRGG